GLLFVSSGAMYRAFTWLVHEQGVDASNTAAVLELLGQTDLSFGEKDGNATVEVGGELLSKDQLSADFVNQNVSVIAAIPEVRVKLVDEQRKYGAEKGVVMEGRDIGSVVFPDTPHKFYIDASPEVREQRRRAQGIIDSIADRDKKDSSRKASPLVIPEDSIVIDSSDLSAEEVVAAVVGKIRG
ncbi:MAG: (d)CMP kinase, partial [Verrucomicrobiota bacterium]